MTDNAFELPDNDLELVEGANGELTATASEVMDQDLSSSDLIDNGAAPADLEQDDIGYRTLEDDLANPQRQDTIDDRVRQEEPEEGHDIVPQQSRNS